MAWDVFLSHASDDKKDVADPLVAELREGGLTVWYDKDELTIGDNLRRRIDKALVESRFAVVIMSPSYFSKKWTNAELDGLFALEEESKKILPVWHNLEPSQVATNAPMLATRLGVSTSKGINVAAKAIIKAVKKGDIRLAAASIIPTPADIERIAPGIESPAIEILKAAAVGDGKIYAAQNDFVYIVRVGRVRFGDDTAPSQAKYKEAIRQLCMSKYVDQHGSIYEVNHRGYELFEKLNVASSGL